MEIKTKSHCIISHNKILKTFNRILKQFIPLIMFHILFLHEFQCPKVSWFYWSFQQKLWGRLYLKKITTKTQKTVWKISLKALQWSWKSAFFFSTSSNFLEMFIIFCFSFYYCSWEYFGQTLLYPRIAFITYAAYP